MKDENTQVPDTFDEQEELRSEKRDVYKRQAKINIILKMKIKFTADSKILKKSVIL